MKVLSYPIRNDVDRHVLTFSGLVHDSFRPPLCGIRDLNELARAIALFTPDATIIDKITPSVANPTDLLIDMVGRSAVLRVAHEYQLENHDALGHVILNKMSHAACAERLFPVPPSGIHAMQRHKNWIGDLYTAEYVMACLDETRCNIADGHAVLDYGCSSGSLVRVLAAIYPGTDFRGCDPVPSSIDWAASSLTSHNLHFDHQQQRPPLPYRDGAFDLVISISIFSHHGIVAAQLWLQEIWRVLKPGGTFIFTIHGVGSILHYTNEGLKPVERYRELYGVYLSTGYAFEEVWTDVDDAGNIATRLDWGSSYYSPIMMASLMAGKFEIISIWRRSSARNQDIYVVRRI